ncbi:M60 family metallopeptidase [Aureibaculum marinum]|nr:M60 family metallopeptidase [Aureibaculum marinum]
MFIEISNAQLNIDATCNQKDGWMPNGWGSYTIALQNTSKKDTLYLSKWEMHWANQKEGKFRDVTKVLAPGEKWKFNEVSHLSQKVVDEFGKKSPFKKGKFIANIKGKQKEFKFKLTIPAAYLPEESKLIKSGDVALSLMKSRYTNFKTIDRAMVWLNQSYVAMEELVGGKPYNGKTIVFKESPENPYFAYAGQEIILNTKFVKKAIEEFDDGIFPFGWIHEMGHDFDDGIGQWYNINGPFTEFQANFKLSYIIETMPEQSFRIPQTINVTDFPIQQRGKKLRGKEFTEKSFLFFGDAYLSDPSRSWESMASDEIHSLFQRIQIMYGWDVFKEFYRSYRDLTAKGFKPPKNTEDKINLMVAILNKHTKVDLTPLFKRWKFPVDKKRIENIEEKYKLNRSKNSKNE